MVYGGEILQTNETKQLFYKIAYKNGFTETKSIHAQNLVCWKTVIKSYSTNLFTNKKLLTIYINYTTISDKNSHEIVNIINNISESIAILIIINKLVPRIKSTLWFKIITKKGILIQAKNMQYKNLSIWIKNRLQHYGYFFTLDEINLLTTYSEGNIVAASQFIEKIVISLPKRKININQISNIIEDHSLFSTFDLLNATSRRDIQRTILVLKCLKKENVDPVLILWSLAKEIKNLLNISYKLKAGLSIKEACDNYKINIDKMHTIQCYLKNLDNIMLEKLLNKVAETDLILKGIKCGSIWNNLLDISLGLTGIITINTCK